MNQEPDSLRELARKTAKSIVDHGSVPMATLKESIILQEKVDELLAKEIEFPEQQEIPEVDLTPIEEKLAEVLDEVKKKDYLEYDLQIDEETRAKLKGDKGDSYILTAKDKKEIANSIEVPVYEKKIITNEVVEIAVPDTPEEIRNKLENLEGEERLDAKSIKGLPEFVEQKTASGYGSVVRDITAGTNITIDKSNPQYPIINATSGESIPATTVVSETTYGLSTAVGTSTNYAREDHSHGSQNNPVGGTDTQVQFNDGGLFGGDTKFLWDKTASTLKIGEGVTPLPNNPLAVQANVDSYLQINLKNNNAGVDSSSDYIATADDGDDTQFYSDIGICNSGYASTAWDAVLPHDTYVFGDGGNVAIASLSVGKKIPFFIAATEHEIHPADLRAEVDSSGINLPTGKTYRINGVDILASGMSNPMTAVGDMIVGGTAGAPAALPIGTNGEVLTLVAGTPSWEAAASFTTEEAQDAVGAMADSESLVYADATPLLSVKVQQSITKDASGLKLSGDSSSPGNNQVYGTDASGVKGWKPDPSSGSGFSKDTIGVTVDGGGSVITTGSKGYKVIQEACTITGWTILGKESGSVVVDIKKCTYAGFPTTSTITGTEKPTLSSAQKNQDLTLTTWTTSLAEGDILEFIVDSASTCTRFNLFINITK